MEKIDKKVLVIYNVNNNDRLELVLDEENKSSVLNKKFDINNREYRIPILEDLRKNKNYIPSGLNFFSFLEFNKINNNLKIYPLSLTCSRKDIFSFFDINEDDIDLCNYYYHNYTSTGFLYKPVIIGYFDLWTGLFITKKDNKNPNEYLFMEKPAIININNSSANLDEMLLVDYVDKQKPSIIFPSETGKLLDLGININVNDLLLYRIFINYFFERKEDEFIIEDISLSNDSFLKFSKYLDFYAKITEDDNMINLYEFYKLINVWKQSQ